MMKDYYKICYREVKNFHVILCLTESDFQKNIADYKRIYDMSKRNNLDTYLKSYRYKFGKWKLINSLS